jgi:hypothetical protein
MNAVLRRFIAVEALRGALIHFTGSRASVFVTRGHAIKEAARSRDVL